MFGINLDTIIKWFQSQQPATVPLASYEALSVDSRGFLQGDGVTQCTIDPSWHYASLRTPKSEPGGIVWHYSATNPGTAMNMARRRVQPWHEFAREWRLHEKTPVPQNSWHLSIEDDGRIIQMAPLKVGCWHAGSNTAKSIPGLGWANYTTVGIELIGYGKVFPEQQVRAACRVARAIVDAYGIDKRFAMVTHQSIDPSRRSDPGPVWMKNHAERVLAYAFA